MRNMNNPKLKSRIIIIASYLQFQNKNKTDIRKNPQIWNATQFLRNKWEDNLLKMLKSEKPPSFCTKLTHANSKPSNPQVTN